MNQKYCPSCGAAVDATATECKYCGQAIAVQNPQQQPQYQQPQFQQSQGNTMYAPTGDPVSTKSRIAAGLFGIFLGGLGVHKFYLGKIGMGILYLVFCWTYIPSLIGFIEGIIYLCSSDEVFYQKYVAKK